jgi:hypothetical protein
MSSPGTPVKRYRLVIDHGSWKSSRIVCLSSPKVYGWIKSPFTLEELNGDVVLKSPQKGVRSQRLNKLAYLDIPCSSLKFLKMKTTEVEPEALDILRLPRGLELAVQLVS